jgi:hypothetical protein
VKDVYFVNNYTIIIPGDTEMALEIIPVGGETADLLGEAGR